MAYRVLDWLKWAGIAVWVFTLFVGATVSYYVYIHEPAVKENIIQVAELGAANRALNTEVASLNAHITRLEGIIGDYLMYEIGFNAFHGQ
jgi:hypothetical protein